MRASVAMRATVALSSDMRENPGSEAAAPGPRADARRKLHALTVCDNAADFPALLPARGSLLALDLSKRRIGLAGTDQERRLATRAGDLRAGRSGPGPGAPGQARARAAGGGAGGRAAAQHGRQRGPDGQGGAGRSRHAGQRARAAGPAAGRAALDLRGRGRDRRGPPAAARARASRSTITRPW